MKELYTISQPDFGGPLMNGFGQVKVFQSYESAEKHLAENFELADRGFIKPVQLEG